MEEELLGKMELLIGPRLKAVTLTELSGISSMRSAVLASGCRWQAAVDGVVRSDSAHVLLLPRFHEEKLATTGDSSAEGFILLQDACQSQVARLDDRASLVLHARGKYCTGSSDIFRRAPEVIRVKVQTRTCATALIQAATSALPHFHSCSCM